MESLIFDSQMLSRWEGKQGGDDMLISTEESVMANFDFLSREDDIEDEDEVSKYFVQAVQQYIRWKHKE